MVSPRCVQLALGRCAICADIERHSGHIDIDEHVASGPVDIDHHVEHVASGPVDIDYHVEHVAATDHRVTDDNNQHVANDDGQPVVKHDDVGAGSHRLTELNCTLRPLLGPITAVTAENDDDVASIAGTTSSKLRPR